MIFKKIALYILCVLLTSFTFAQKVAVTGGKFANENPTKIILNAVDGKSTNIFEVMSVYNTEGTVMGYSDGYLVPLTTTSTSEKTRLICDTPAELVLDKGAITLLAGNSTDISDEFTINATGGTQHWNIRAENPVLYWTGVALAIVGTCFCTYGVMDWAVETQEATVFNTVSTFGGAAGLAGGIVMGFLGSPKATLVKIEY